MYDETPKKSKPHKPVDDIDREMREIGLIRPESDDGDATRADAIKRGAGSLQIDPEDYATAISYESAKTFDPWVKGPVTKWGQHRGTIQYGEPQRKQYGVHEKQTFEEQVTDSNVRYLKDAGVKPGMAFPQIYAAINGGSVNKNLNTPDANTGRTIADNIRIADQEHRPLVKKRFGQYFGTATPFDFDKFEAELLGQNPPQTIEAQEFDAGKMRPVSPTFPGGQSPPIIPGSSQSAPIPELPQTLEAQRKAAHDPQSTRAAVLYPLGTPMPPRVDGEMDLQFKDGQTLRASAEKLQKFLAATGIQAGDIESGAVDFTPLLGGKAQPTDSTAGKNAVITRDARTGHELVASSVETPDAIETETAMQKAQFPNMPTTTEVVGSDAVIAGRQPKADVDIQYQHYLEELAKEGQAPITREQYDAEIADQGSTTGGYGGDAVQVDPSTGEIVERTIQEATDSAPGIKLVKNDPTVGVAEATRANIAQDLVDSVTAVIARPKNKAAFAAREAIDAGYAQLPENVRAANAALERVTGRSFWNEEPDYAPLVQKALDTTGEANIRHDINRGAQAIIELYEREGEQGLRQRLLGGPGFNANVQALAEGHLKTANPKFAREKELEAEHRKQAEEDATGGVMSLIKEGVSHTLESLSPFRAVRDLTEGRPEKSVIGGFMDFEGKAEESVADIKKIYGSFSNYERKQQEWKNESFARHGLRYTATVGRGVGSMLTTAAESVAVTDRFIERYLQPDFIPENLRPSIRNYGNGLAYLKSQLFGGEYTPEGTDDEVDKGRIMSLVKAYKEAIPKDPYADKSTTGEALTVGTNAVMFLLGGVALRGSKAAIALLGSSQQVGSMYDQMRQRGISDKDAVFWSNIAGHPLGASEVIGIGGMGARYAKLLQLGTTLKTSSMKTFLRSMGQFTARRLHEGKREFKEEFWQEFGQNTIGDAAINTLAQDDIKGARAVLEFFNQLPETASQALPQALMAGAAGFLLAGGSGTAVDIQNTINERQSRPNYKKLSTFQFKTDKINIAGQEYDTPETAKDALDEAGAESREAAGYWAKAQKLLDQAETAKTFASRKALLLEAKALLRQGNEAFNRAERSGIEAQNIAQEELGITPESGTVKASGGVVKERFNFDKFEEELLAPEPAKTAAVESVRDEDIPLGEGMGMDKAAPAKTTRPVNKTETLTVGTPVIVPGKGEGVVIEDKGKNLVVDHTPKTNKKGETVYQSRSTIRKNQVEVIDEAKAEILPQPAPLDEDALVQDQPVESPDAANVKTSAPTTDVSGTVKDISGDVRNDLPEGKRLSGVGQFERNKFVIDRTKSPEELRSNLQDAVDVWNDPQFTGRNAKSQRLLMRAQEAVRQYEYDNVPFGERPDAIQAKPQAPKLADDNIKPVEPAKPRGPIKAQGIRLEDKGGRPIEPSPNAEAENNFPPISEIRSPEYNIRIKEGVRDAEGDRQQDYVDQAMRNLQATSRTAQGVVDTSSTPGKAEQMTGVSGQEAADIAIKNFEEAFRYVERIYGKREGTMDTFGARKLLDEVAARINKGILKADVLKRTEDSDKFAYTHVADLDRAYDQFTNELAKRLNDPKADPIETAAWIEWRTNITDHFWADGVGKTSKVLAAIPLMRAGLPLPKYRDNEEMFALQPKAPIEPKGLSGNAYLGQEWLKFLDNYRSLFGEVEETKEPEHATKQGNSITYKGVTVELEPIDLSKDPRLAAIQEKTLADVIDEPGKWVEKYYNEILDDDGKPVGRKMINADDAKTLFPEYRADRLANVQGVHEASSAIAKLVLGIRLKELSTELDRPANVLLMGGGAAAGKTRSANMQIDNADLVFDGTMKSEQANEGLINQVLDAGHVPNIVFVFRDVAEAGKSNVERSVKHGRIVPISVAGNGHFNAAKALIDHTYDYAMSHGATVEIVNNVTDQEPQKISLEELKGLVYNNVEEATDRFRDASYAEYERNKSKYDDRLPAALEGRTTHEKSGIQGELSQDNAAGDGLAQEGKSGRRSDEEGTRPQVAETPSAPVDFDAIFEQAAGDKFGKTPEQKEQDDAINGLIDAFGFDDVPLKSVLAEFDETRYETKLKGALGKAFATFEATTPAESMRALLDALEASNLTEKHIREMKPYIVRFMQDKFTLQSGENESIDELEAENVTNGTKSDADGQDSDAGESTADVQGTVEGRPPKPRGPRKSESGDANVSPNAGTGNESGSDLEPAGDGADAGSVQAGTTGPRISDKPSDGVPKRKLRRDYIAPAGSLTREGSWKTSASNNLDAIELAKKIEAEDRLATPEEQAKLVKFVGWGAGELANNVFIDPDSFKANATQDWNEIRTRLNQVMTPDEIKTAQRSTQYAHYTSEKVIRGIWSAMEQFGFAKGSILEPGMGTGLFAVAAPKNLISNSGYTGIEMDAMTARIAKLLLPDQAVLENDYIKQKLPMNHFDVAIGNPPFADIKITADPKYKKHKFYLHDYFFAKTLDAVRPGGLLAFVTSKGTMDKIDAKAREYIAAQADLLGAIRLPQTAFKQNAGTEVVTDVLFFRKRMAGEEPGGEKWLGHAEITAKNADGQDQTGLVNEYYANHPDMVLGEHSFTGSMRARNQYTVIPKSGDIEEHFLEAVKNLPKAVFAKQGKAQDVIDATSKEDWNPAAKKEGSIYIHEDGTLMVRDSGRGVNLVSQKKLSPKEVHWLKAYVGLRQALKQAQYDQLNAEKEGTDWESSLAELNKVYDAFVKKHGNILAFTERERIKKDDDGNEISTISRTFKNEKLLANDVESPLVWTLEKITDDGDIIKSNWLKERQIKPPQPPKIENIKDALMVSLDTMGKLNIPHVAELIAPIEKMTEAEIIAELGNLIYEEPGGGWVMADEYLSGNVKAKLEVAEAAASDERFRRNVEALRGVQPLPLPAEKITVQVGAPWVPAETVSQFATEILGVEGKNEKHPTDYWRTITGPAVEYDPVLGKWNVPEAHGSGSQSKRNAASEWGTGERSPAEVLEAALNGETVTIMATDLGPPRRQYTDKNAIQAVQTKIEKINQAFKPWLFSDAERGEAMVKIYNEKMNVMADRQFDGRHLSVPGLSVTFKLHDHVKRAIWRVVQTGNTYLAHAVGAGKTLEMIASAMEQKRLGLISKPMFVVPNQVLKQFASEFLQAYPLANIMVADEQNFHADNRRRFVAQAALNDLDGVIITHSAFGLLKTTEESSRAVLDDLLAEMQDAMDELTTGTDNNGNPVGDSMQDTATIKRIQNRMEKIEQKFFGKMNAARDDVLDFEELGVDFLYVDEAHEFRKLDFTTNQANLKGVDPSGSLKAIDLLVKSRWLDKQRPGRSMVLASGTPITNTMAELYSIQRFLGHRGLIEDGLDHFDSWAKQFGQVEENIEANAAGGYKAVKRFSKFVNTGVLMQRVRAFMDVITLPQLQDLIQVPKVKLNSEGKPSPEVVIAEKTELLDRYLKEVLAERIKTSEAWKPSFLQKNNPDPLIAIIGDGQHAAFDMRFIYPDSPNEPNSKLNKMIDGIIDSYHQHNDLEYINTTTGEPYPIKGASHIVFSYGGFGEQVMRNRGFNSRAWVRKRLTEAGIPANEIAFIWDYKTSTAKEGLFKEVREGKKKIMIGSPQNMGTGVNAQTRLKTLHYGMAPWFPAYVEQPHGRIIRHGNQNEEVELYWYAAKGTYDEAQWGMLSRKSKAIEDALTGNYDGDLEDVSESSQFAMASALASGDPRALRYAELRGIVEKYNRLEQAHSSTANRLIGELTSLTSTWYDSIAGAEKTAKEYGDALALVPVDKVTKENFEITIGKETFDKDIDKNNAEIGTALKDQWSKVVKSLTKAAISKNEPVIGDVAKVLGKFRVVALVKATSTGVGTDLSIYIGNSRTGLTDGNAVYNAAKIADISESGLITRIYNAINSLADKKAEAEKAVKERKARKSEIEDVLDKPFEFEKESNDARAEMNQLGMEMAGLGIAPPPLNITFAELKGIVDSYAISVGEKQATPFPIGSMPVSQFKKLDDEDVSEADRMTTEEMRALPFEPIETILAGAEMERKGDQLRMNAKSHELLRRSFEESRIRKAAKLGKKLNPKDYENLFEGVFLRPETIADTATILRDKAAEARRKGYSQDEVNTFTAHADMLEAAAKAGKGTAVIFVLDKALPEELFHQADYLGAAEKTLLNRHSDKAKSALDTHPIRNILWTKHFSKFNEYQRYKSEKVRSAILRAEIPPYLLKLSEAEATALGITQDMIDDYLVTWFEGYVAKNGIESVKYFEKEEINVQRFIEKVKESNAARDKPVRQEIGGGTQTANDEGSEARGSPQGSPGARSDGVGRNQRLRSLPATMRAAGLDAVDEAYDVYPDKAATEDAERLLNELGIEGSISLLRNIAADAQDAQHAILSFMLIRTLLNHSIQVRASDPDTSEKHHKLAMTLAREHAVKATQAGRFTRIPSVIGATTEHLMYAVQGVIEDTFDSGKTFSPKYWAEWEALGRQLEEAHAKLSRVNKDKRNLQAQVRRLKEDKEGKKRKRRTSSGQKNRQRLVQLVKDKKAAAVDKIRARLHERFGDSEPMAQKSVLASAAQKDTPAFRHWFGESAVVDEKGEPLVVYHGTDSDFDVFDKSQGGRSTGTAAGRDGFFFTSHAPTATRYAEFASGFYAGMEQPPWMHISDNPPKPNLVPTFLSLQNPLLVQRAKYKEKVLSETAKDAAIIQAQEQGNDGVIFRDFQDSPYTSIPKSADIFIVFNPNQIKSAIGNRGTFDPNDDSILKSVLDEEFPIDDFAEVGAMFLTEGLAGEEDYLPSTFQADMINEFGDVITPYFDVIYSVAWAKRGEWLNDVRAKETKERIEAKYNEGEELEDWEIEEILGQQKEKAKRRRFIEKYHALRAGESRKNPHMGTYKRIISEIAENENAAIGAILHAENVSSGGMYARLKELGVTDEKEQREAIRQGAAVWQKAKIEFQKEQNAIANQILTAENDLKNIDDYRFVARNEMANVQRTVSDEMRRLKKGEISYRGGQIVDITNAMRTMMASFDLSGALRQGGFFVMAHPGMQRKAFANMFKSIAEKGYGRAVAELEEHDLFTLAQRAGIDFAIAGRNDSENSLMGEELFRGEQMIEKIPGLGYLLAEGVVKPSERTYTAFLDTQRMVMFNLFARELAASGLNFKDNPSEFKKIAEFVNIATGRGTLPSAKFAKILMNLPLFAPRYTLSRMQLINMTLNPIAYAKMPPHARKIVMKSAVRAYGTTMGILGMVTAFGAAIGASVNWDPDDDDYLKIKIGNTHYDIFFGMLPFAKLMIKIGHSAVRTKLGFDNRVPGEFFWDTGKAIARFGRGKLAPISSLIFDIGSGSDYIGNKTEIWGDKWYKPGKAIYSRLTPLTISDAIEAFKVDGLIGIAKSTPFSVFGVGVSTYKPRLERPETEAEKLAAKMKAWNFSGSSKLEKEQRDLKNELIARSRMGEDVSAEASKFGDYHKKEILSAASKTLLVDKAEGLSLDNIEQLYRVANESEKKELLPMLGEKMKNAEKDNKLSPEQRTRLETLGARVVGDYPMPDAVRAEFDRFGLKIPDVGETLTPRKGGPKVHLNTDQYGKYRRETLERIYIRIDSMIKDRDYREANDDKKQQMIERTIGRQRAREQKETKRELAAP